MRIFYNLIICFLLLFNGNVIAYEYNKCIEGNGITKTEALSVSPFSTLVVNGPFSIHVVAGVDKYSVKITADANLLNLISVKHNDDKLIIDSKRSICTSGPLNILLEVPKLLKVELKGAEDITVTKLKQDSFTLNSIGTADITLSGKVKVFSFSLSGASDLNAENLEAEKVKVKIKGTAEATVFAKKKLIVSIEGAGSLYYKDNPEIIRKKVTGVASIEKL